MKYSPAVEKMNAAKNSLELLEYLLRGEQTYGSRYASRKI